MNPSKRFIMINDFLSIFSLKVLIYFMAALEENRLHKINQLCSNVDKYLTALNILQHSIIQLSMNICFDAHNR